MTKQRRPPMVLVLGKTALLAMKDLQKSKKKSKKKVKIVNNVTPNVFSFFEAQKDHRCGMHALNNLFMNYGGPSDYLYVMNNNTTSNNYVFNDYSVSKQPLFDMYKYCEQKNVKLSTNHLINQKTNKNEASYFFGKKCALDGDFDITFLMNVVNVSPSFDVYTTGKSEGLHDVMFMKDPKIFHSLKTDLEHVQSGRLIGLIINLGGWHYSCVLYNKRMQGLYEIDSVFTSTRGLVNKEPKTVEQMLIQLTQKRNLVAYFGVEEKEIIYVNGGHYKNYFY